MVYLLIIFFYITGISETVHKSSQSSIPAQVSQNTNNRHQDVDRRHLNGSCDHSRNQPPEETPSSFKYKGPLSNELRRSRTTNATQQTCSLSESRVIPYSHTSSRPCSTIEASKSEHDHWFGIDVNLTVSEHIPHLVL